MEFTWSDIRIVAEELYDKFPQKHPLEIRFTDLHQEILELEGFVGDPQKSSEKILESIQMLWYEEWQEDNDSADDPYANFDRS